MACSTAESSSSPSPRPSRSGNTESNASCWDWKKALSAEVNLFRGFAFAFTLVFTLLLFLSFYLFYLRLRRLRRLPLHWSEPSSSSNAVSTAELGLKKELREMLPVIVFKESFSVSDTLRPKEVSHLQAQEELKEIDECVPTKQRRSASR